MPILFRPVVACVEVKIKAHWRDNPDTAVMTLHAKTPGSTPDAAAVEEIVTTVQSWVEDGLTMLISSDWNIYSIYGESMAQDPPPFFAVNTNLVGVRDPSDDPAWAPLALLHGPLAGRSYLGRSYLFGPEEAAVLESGYDPTLLTSIVTAYQSLNTTLTDGGYNLAVPSKKNGQCVFVNSITHSIRKTMQKRRRVGFGG